jgi:hypothetical protein
LQQEPSFVRISFVYILFGGGCKKPLRNATKVRSLSLFLQGHFQLPD